MNNTIETNFVKGGVQVVVPSGGDDSWKDKTLTIDKTLTVSDAAADAGVVGNIINAQNQSINDMENAVVNLQETADILGRTVEEILSPIDVYMVSGYGLWVTDKSGDSFSNYGSATVMLLKGGICKIDFGLKIIAASTSTTFGKRGMTVEYITRLVKNAYGVDLPKLTPVSGGDVKVFRPATISGTTIYHLDSNLYGYYGYMGANFDYWSPTRVYNTSGGTGGWALNSFPVNAVISGTCYAKY